MPISVKRIGHAEAVRSGNVIVEAYAQPPWEESWSIENATARLEELTTTPGSVGFAAFDRDQVVGFVFALPHTAAVGRGLHIAEIAMLPRYQRQKVGSSLLSLVEAEAKKLDYRHIWLVSRLTGGVSEYYRANGYTKSSTLGVYTKRLAGATRQIL
jgi:ribosomal protein S18 acetylase RimI-like enzyme